MEKNELSIGQQKGLATLPDSRLQKAVFKFSMLRAFPLSEIEILEWARVLQNSNVSTEAIDFVVLKMQTCEMDYNEREGIQNIFRNLRLVKKTEKGYEILKPIW